MKYTLAQKMQKSLWWLLAIGAISAVAVQGAYMYKFGRGSWFSLSDNPEVWGQYGDYIGGLLNPIFSSLAFSGLVITIVLQARQIDEAKRNAELEEVQRVQSTIAARIDELLATKLVVNMWGAEKLKGFGDIPTMFELISSLGTYSLSDQDPKLKWLWDEELFAQLRQAVDIQTIPLRLEFESLSFMLKRYADHEGARSVIDFYQYRFGAILTWLDALGLLEEHHQVQSFFKPKALRQAMTPG